MIIETGLELSSVKRKLIDTFDSAPAPLLGGGTDPGSNTSKRANVGSCNSSNNRTYTRGKPPRFPKEFLKQHGIHESIYEAYFLHENDNISYINKHTMYCIFF